MKFSYIRPTKLHPEPAQRAALAGLVFDEEYLDGKPQRGEPSWYWWNKLVLACRPGKRDEVHVSDASVIADSVPIALKRIGDITVREAVLVIASTGKRYSWHPDAAMAIELAMEMAKEARRAVARIGGEARAQKAAAKRECEEQRTREIEQMWRDKSVPTEDVVQFAGISRDALYKRLGARGLEPFVGVKRESTS